jgi:hypothetical protein
MRRSYWAGLSLLALAGTAAAWAALAPVQFASREVLFEIPKGTWARRMAGEPLAILPARIHMTLGINDVLVLKNLDDVPQIFGPTLMMPGQGFRLPFAVAASYDFACSAHAGGQMTIVVDPQPVTAWGRLAWRARTLLGALGRA